MAFKGLDTKNAYKAAYTKAVRNSILDLRAKDITELPLGIFQLHEFVPDDNGWWELLIPHTLLLTHNSIKNLNAPNNYNWNNAWKNLQTLNIAYNKISEIPSEILKLEFLRKLIFHHNNLTNICFVSSSSRNLMHIELQNNNLESLHDNIGECINLQYLNISHNKLVYLPQSLSKCINLQLFEAVNNNISDDLKNIKFSKLTKLREFDISNNNITSIDSSLFYLPSLYRLSATQNKINKIDNKKNELEQKQDSQSHLIELYLGNNKLSQFPFDSLRLHSLKLLDLKCNNFVKIDKTVCQCCVNLERFDISENDLQDVPAELSLMQSIKTVIVKGNPLRRMNKSVFNNDSHLLINYLRKRLKKVENIDNSMPKFDINKIQNGELKLNHQNLLSLPLNMCKMGNLCHLELDDNKLSDIDDLKYCKKLKYLSARKNNISHIASLFGLDKLQVIDLSINKLQVQLLSDLNIWPELYSLKLGYNQMTNVSKLLECISSKNMTILDIGNNKINVFPNCILNWKLLQVLDLSNNDLSQIPFKLGELNKLNGLMLFGNNLRRMQNVINHGNTQKILDWLKNRIY